MEMPEKKPWTTPVFKIGDEVKVRKESSSRDDPRVRRCLRFHNCIFTQR